MNDTRQTPALVTETLLFEESTWGTLRVSGPERLSWLQRVISCDLESLREGQGAYGLVLQKTGKILGDVTVVAASELVYLGCAGDVAEDLQAHLDRLLVMEDAEIELRSDALSWLRVLGPEAGKVAREAGGVACAAIAWPGVAGAALVIEREATAAMVSRLCSGSVRLLAPHEWEALRIASGLPLFGQDFTAQDTPHQAALERAAVSWNKGCYVGQEVVCKQDMLGKTRRRTMALVGPVEVARERGALVKDETGAEVGHVTSAAIHPDGSGAVALARLKATCSEPGRELVVNDARVRVGPAGGAG